MDHEYRDLDIGIEGSALLSTADIQLAISGASAISSYGSRMRPPRNGSFFDGPPFRVCSFDLSVFGVALV